MADKVKEFFVNNPKYNEDKDFEAYSSMTLAINLLFIVNALLHSVYLVGFSLVGIQELAIVEIIDVTLYAAGVIFIKYVNGHGFLAWHILYLKPFRTKLCVYCSLVRKQALNFYLYL